MPVYPGALRIADRSALAQREARLCGLISPSTVYPRLAREKAGQTEVTLMEVRSVSRGNSHDCIGVMDVLLFLLLSLVLLSLLLSLSGLLISWAMELTSRPTTASLSDCLIANSVFFHSSMLFRNEEDSQRARRA
jgi:hypothetical protein